MSDRRIGEFEALAAADDGPSVVGEFWGYLRSSRKWWLLPIVAVLALLGGLVMLSGTAAAPFLYTLF